MNRVMIVLVLALAALTAGCGPTLEQQRTQAIGQFQMGKLDAAEEGLQQVVSHRPGDSLALYYLGRVRHARNELVMAIYYYQCALTADPSNREARQWLERAKHDAGPIGPDLEYLPKTRTP